MVLLSLPSTYLILAYLARCQIDCFLTSLQVLFFLLLFSCHLATVALSFCDLYAVSLFLSVSQSSSGFVACTALFFSKNSIQNIYVIGCLL